MKNKKRFFAKLAKVVFGALTIIFFLLMLWLFLVVTPDQCSAECEAAGELLRLEMHDGRR